MFFESPEFPYSMKENHKKACRLNIFVNHTNQMENKSLMFMITNGQIENGTLTTDNLKTELFSYNSFENNIFHRRLTAVNFSLSFEKTSSTKFTAFQGYFSYENIKDCPFNGMTYNFENESQIIYITSHYTWRPINDNYVDCKWIFRGPKKYGFKLVNRSSNNSIEITAKNSTEYDIIKGLGLKKDHVYYNNDNYLIINVHTNILFQAYITIIKNNAEVVDAGCTNKKFGRKIIWTNLRAEAYPNNAECNITIAIPFNFLVTYTLGKMNFESDIDYLKFEDLNGITRRVDYLRTSEQIFFYKCICAPERITVPCKGEHQYPVMNQTLYHLCPNTICNFTIINEFPCESEYLVLKFSTPIRHMLGLKIFVNDEVYLDLLDLDSNVRKFSFPLLPNSKLIYYSIVKSTYQSATPVYFTLAVLQKPTLLQPMILTNQKPSYKINLTTFPKNSIFTVELSTELMANNDTLEMFTSGRTYLECILLYSDKSLKKVVNSLGRLFLRDYRITSAVSLTIYKSDECDQHPNGHMPVVYRAKNVHTQHCTFTENIFYKFRKAVSTFAGISKSSGHCELILLLPPYRVHLNYVYTNSKNDLVKFFTDDENSETVFSFNKYNSVLWENMILGAVFYTIVVPPSSNVIISLTGPKKYVSFKKFPVKSFVETQTYGSRIKYYGSLNAIERIAGYKISNNSITFSTIISHLSPDAQLYITDATNNTFSLNDKNQTYEFQNTELSLYYYEPNDGYMGARIFISSKNDSIN